MFEAIHGSVAIPKTESVTSAPVTAPAASPQYAGVQKPEADVMNQADSGTAEKQAREDALVSEEFLAELEQDFNRMHNIGLNFSTHEPTGRTMIRVMDKDSETLIREIPAEKILDLAARLEEMIGILFDETV